jgi:hypothetical protein
MESILETKASTILEFLAGLHGALSVHTFQEVTMRNKLARTIFGFHSFAVADQELRIPITVPAFTPACSPTFTCIPQGGTT